VDATADAGHARGRAAAGAGLATQRREIAGPVAEQRQRLLRQRREHELAELALLDGRAGRGIDGLDEEVILVHVRAALLLALERDARAEDLREAVDVERSDSECPFDLRAEGLRPGLGPVDPRAQTEPAAVLDVVGDGQRVARGAAENLGAEVLEQLNLPGGVASRGRDDRAAETLGAVVQPQAAGEEAVAVGDVDDRSLFAARGGDGAGAAL